MNTCLFQAIAAFLLLGTLTACQSSIGGMQDYPTSLSH